MGKLSKKGFTLVEIIVSLAIFSAVLAMLAGVLVSGFKYFYTTSETDSNKRVTDELMEYIRDELVYATDVVISDTYPEGQWRVFSVEDGILKHGELSNGTIKDFGVFQEKSFYNYNTFQLTTRTYENNRLDIQCTLNDSNEQVYTTRETLELLNVSADKYDLLPPITNIGENGIKIYYKKDIRTVNNGEGDITPPELESGYETVGSLPDYISTANNRGLYQEGRRYFIGDMVYWNGSWWRKTNNINTSAPSIGGAGYWQKAEEEYLYNNEYLPGDVVTYELSDGRMIYLQAQRYIKVNETTYIPEYDMIDDPNKDKMWVGAFDRKQLEKNHYDVPYTKNYYTDTVLKKLLDKYPEYDFSDATASQIDDVWNLNKKYNVGDFTKVKSNNSNYYYKYLKVFDTVDNQQPGSSYYSGWQLLELDFTEKSCYLTDDLVVGKQLVDAVPTNTQFIYWQAKRNIITDVTKKEYEDSMGRDLYGEEVWAKVGSNDFDTSNKNSSVFWWIRVGQ